MSPEHDQLVVHEHDGYPEVFRESLEGAHVAVVGRVRALLRRLPDRLEGVDDYEVADTLNERGFTATAGDASYAYETKPTETIETSTHGVGATSRRRTSVRLIRVHTHRVGMKYLEYNSKIYKTPVTCYHPSTV